MALHYDGVLMYVQAVRNRATLMEITAVAQTDDTPPLRGHQPWLGINPVASACIRADGTSEYHDPVAEMLADLEQRQREQEEQDEAGREEAERWGKMWGNNEASMDVE